MLDLHAHVLPGFDDGVRTIGEARELARAAAAEGVTAIAATPHVRDDYPTTAERMLRGVERLRADFAEQGIAVDVLPGGELDLHRIRHLGAEGAGAFGLGEARRWLLVETPYRGWPAQLAQTVEVLRRAGFETLLAHPERNQEVQRDPGLLTPLVAAGLRVQITAASVDGRLGEAPRRCAERLLEARIAHVLATDAHGPEVRGGGLSAAIAAIGDESLSRFLTLEAPAAIVAGGNLPSRAGG